MNEPVPRISLIVCTTGEASRMPALSTRLAAVLHSSPDAEALVVDNSRAGGLALQDPRIRIVRAALPGLSFARTTGCIHARGDVLVFTDDDVEFDPDWPARMASPLLAGEWDAVAAPIRLHPDFDAVRSPLVRAWLAEANLGGEPHLVGAGMAVHRRMLGLGLWDQRIGAGHADFAFGEETLFDWMIRAGGARVGVVAGADVVHRPDPGRIARADLLRLAHQKGMSGAYVGHHWWGESMPHPRLRGWRRRLRLLLHRARRRTGTGWDDEELRLAEAVGVADGYRLVSGEPRSYVRGDAAR